MLYVRRLRMNREAIMQQWDAWREYIANGGQASWPRDAFESLLDDFDESKIEYPFRICVELLHYSIWSCKKTEDLKYSEVKKLLLNFFDEEEIAKAQDVLMGKT